MGSIWKNRYVRFLTIVLLVQATLFYSASHGDSRLPLQPLAEFPKSLQNWQMLTQGVIEKETMDVLRADDILARFYVNVPASQMALLTPQQRQALFPSSVELFLAYFSTQQNGQAPHSPKNCLPGSGWESVDTGEISIPIQGASAPIKINKYGIAKGEEQSVVLYWYQSHGRVVANEFAAKFYLVADSLRYHRSDTALVRVVAPVLANDSNRALKSAIQFVQASYPAIYRFLPM